MKSWSWEAFWNERSGPECALNEEELEAEEELVENGIVLLLVRVGTKPIAAASTRTIATKRTGVLSAAPRLLEVDSSVGFIHWADERRL